MNIPIELLVVLAVLVFVIFWFVLVFFLKIIKLWRYKPENDKGKIGEERRRAELARTRDSGLERVTPFKRPSVFQATPVSRDKKPNLDNGTSSSSSRETSRSPRKFRHPFLRDRRR